MSEHREAKVQEVYNQWRAVWESSLRLWSKFTRLSEPIWCFTDDEAAQEGLTESFAMIRLTDQAIVINVDEIAKLNLQKFASEILAHEIGHHILCPANLTDQGRMIARIRRALPTKEAKSAFVSNLYADLQINDRLQRGSGLSISQVYLALETSQVDRLWGMYMRIYELLWSLPRGTLARMNIDDQMEGDAILGSRLIRAYSKEWIEGSGKFAALCLPYLVENEGEKTHLILKGWLDTQNSGAGSGEIFPAGLIVIEAGELEGSIHPANDPAISGILPNDKIPPNISGRGQVREPFEYGEILRALGMSLSDHEIAVRYYKERALPYLIPFPKRISPEGAEPLPEGLETWEVGSPLEDIDWLNTLETSPKVIPGITTQQRVYGTIEDANPVKTPIDLDIYIDSSGSMTNPQINTSYPALAGTIIILSALRSGAKVQATLWSGAKDFETTNGFIRNEKVLLQIITGYIGGSTSFPIHILRDTYKDRRKSDSKVHILVISDDGVTTMFNQDEFGDSGWYISRMALDHCGAGGSFVLNLYSKWQKVKDLPEAHDQGWNIFPIRDWSELVEFARKFAATIYDTGLNNI